MVNAADELSQVAGSLAQKVNGGRVRKVHRIIGGVVNQVFDVALTTGNVVVRMNKDSLLVYRKEQWAMNQARQAGVRVPEVYEVGEDIGWSYMLMQKIEGQQLTQCRANRRQIVRDTGRMARLVNDIAVSGFGFHLDLTAYPPAFTSSWEELVSFEQQWIFGKDTLVRMNALTPDEVLSARAFIEPMLLWHPAPNLCHGDLQPDNIIVTANGEPYLIDWTLTKGGPCEFDVARFAATAPNDVQDFIAGFGWTQEDFEIRKPNLNRVALTDVLRAAAWAYDNQHAKLEKFATDVRVEFERILGKS